MALAASVRPPWWRNVRVLRVVGQIIFVAVVVAIGREMYLNATFQLEARGTELSYRFLDTRAGFSIKESIISYSATRDYFRAFSVAVTNAMLVAVVGIILATILGLIIGILRLSPNWLLRKITQVYVEVIRNIPALVQVVFWYVAVILQIPRIEKSVSVFGIAYVSNRGAAIPTVRGGADFGLWGLFVGAGLIGALLIWRWRTRVGDDTGQPSYRITAAVGSFVAVAVLG
ncbi:MAG: ABC transporter permease subunit, partial [Actinomycetota bacterium]